nr:hypothetical protein [Tanacetum cinerariifolium]
MASGFLVMPSGYASDGVRILATTSERNRVKEALEDSAERRRHSYKATSSRLFLSIYNLSFRVLKGPPGRRKIDSNFVLPTGGAIEVDESGIDQDGGDVDPTGAGHIDADPTITGPSDADPTSAGSSYAGDTSFSNK